MLRIKQWMKASFPRFYKDKGGRALGNSRRGHKPTQYGKKRGNKMWNTRTTAVVIVPTFLFFGVGILLLKSRGQIAILYNTPFAMPTWRWWLVYSKSLLLHMKHRTLAWKPFLRAGKSVAARLNGTTTFEFCIKQAPSVSNGGRRRGKACRESIVWKGRKSVLQLNVNLMPFFPRRGGKWRHATPYIVCAITQQQLIAASVTFRMLPCLWKLV